MLNKNKTNQEKLLTTQMEKILVKGENNGRMEYDGNVFVSLPSCTIFLYCNIASFANCSNHLLRHSLLTVPIFECTGAILRQFLKQTTRLCKFI